MRGSRSAAAPASPTAIELTAMPASIAASSGIAKKEKVDLTGDDREPTPLGARTAHRMDIAPLKRVFAAQVTPPSVLKVP